MLYAMSTFPFLSVVQRWGEKKALRCRCQTCLGRYQTQVSAFLSCECRMILQRWHRSVRDTNIGTGIGAVKENIGFVRHVLEEKLRSECIQAVWWHSPGSHCHPHHHCHHIQYQHQLKGHPQLVSHHQGYWEFCPAWVLVPQLWDPGQVPMRQWKSWNWEECTKNHVGASNMESPAQVSLWGMVSEGDDSGWPEQGVLTNKIH